MELNLNELERRAKSAGGQEWTLTIDATGDAFLSAENSEYVAEVGAVGEDGIVSDYGKFIAAANPAVVLELVLRLRDAEARVTVTTDESGRAVAVTRQDDEHRILSVIWEAPVTAPVRLTDRDKDDLAAPYSGMGGIEDYRAYAQDIETAALRANGFDIQPARGADGE